MSSSNLLKNIISKDKNVSENTIKELLNNKDSKGFRELCEKSDFIFPFIKEKIINNFVKIVNKETLSTIFEFSKIYSYDFEDIIVKSWLKFADEDLTDEILELFCNGTNEQKAYCAKYFSRINDSLALENLEKYIYSDFEPLRINSVSALKAFNIDISSSIKDKISSLDNEFDKIPLYQILSICGGKENVNFVINNSMFSPYSANIVSNVLDNVELSQLASFLDSNMIFYMFNVLLDNYPENIDLNTIVYYQISDFIKYLQSNLNPYSINLLALAKKQFLEYEKNEIYNFDLDKEAKEELKKINSMLSSYNPDFSKLEEELNLDSLRFETAIKTVEEYKINSASDILSDLINNKNISLNHKALVAQALKALNHTDLIVKENIEKLENENIKALILDLIRR